MQRLPVHIWLFLFFCNTANHSSGGRARGYRYPPLANGLSATWLRGYLLSILDSLNIWGEGDKPKERTHVAWEYGIFFFGCVVGLDTKFYALWLIIEFIGINDWKKKFKRYSTEMGFKRNGQISWLNGLKEEILSMKIFQNLWSLLYSCNVVWVTSS